MIQFKISEDLNGARIDQALLECEKIISRSQAKKLLSQGLVKYKGKMVKPSFKVEEGMVFDIDFPDVVKEKLAPYDFPLEIIHEDSDIIVVNKPAGLVVHPSHGHENDTLINALIYHCKDLSIGFHEDRPGLIHRLDRDTSGTIVIAKNERAQNSLAKQFQKKTTHRKYWALVFGHPKHPQAKVESILDRHPTDRKRFASLRKEGTQRPNLVVNGIADMQTLEIMADGVDLKRGKKAVTNYRVLTESAEFSLVELMLETGRTHQIRIHLSELGHPVVGDELYGGKTRANNCKSPALRKYIKEMDRFALHAKELGFKHPSREERVYFNALWPNDLNEILNLTKINLPDQEIPEDLN